ncbi:unnamed protein product, partial [Durusdinium trenchii]
DDIRSPSRHWHHALLRNYFASRGIKHALMNIARATDEAYLAKLRASSLAMTGKELPNQEKKLYLFCGPPGTGKTFGMKIIAAECGLDAYQLKLKKIDYDAPDAFRRALQRLQDQSARSGRSVAVFVDEAEVLFGSRASMQDYHSVLVTQKKQIVTEFLTWVDGLETKASGAASVILIMATNLESSMDEAILSRVAETVHFDLPNFRQCRQFWAGLLGCAEKFFLALFLFCSGALSLDTRGLTNHQKPVSLQKTWFGVCEHLCFSWFGSGSW